MTFTIPVAPAAEPYVATPGQILHRLARVTLGILPTPIRIERDDSGAPYVDVTFEHGTPDQCRTAVNAWHRRLLEDGGEELSAPRWFAVPVYRGQVCFDGWTVTLRAEVPAGEEPACEQARTAVKS